MISFKDDTLYSSETRTIPSARTASLGDERLLEQFWQRSTSAAPLNPNEIGVQAIHYINLKCFLL